MADGHLSEHRLTINLNKKDKMHLELLKIILNLKGKYVIRRKIQILRKDRINLV